MPVDKTKTMVKWNEDRVLTVPVDDDLIIFLPGWNVVAVDQMDGLITQARDKFKAKQLEVLGDKLSFNDDGTFTFTPGDMSKLNGATLNNVLEDTYSDETLNYLANTEVSPANTASMAMLRKAKLKTDMQEEIERNTK